MADNNTENITNKNGTELVRDENGRVVSGVLNPNGRPKKGLTLTDIAKEILDEELPDGKTRKEVLMRKIATLAYEGNETMIKLLWNYIDGLPVQKTEISGADGGAIEIDTNNAESEQVYQKFIESMKEIYGNKTTNEGKEDT